MNASMRDLRRGVAPSEAPDVDVAGLVAAGERRLRRRRAAVIDRWCRAVLALAIGAATLAGRDRPLPGARQEPSPAGVR